MNTSKTILFALCGGSNSQTDLMLRSLLADHGELLTLATVFQETSALEVIPCLRPDAILVEVPSDPHQAEARLARFRKVDPTSRLVAWIRDPDPELARSVLAAGATDCLSARTISPALLVASLGLAGPCRAIRRPRPDRYDPLTGLLSQSTLVEHVGRLLDRRCRSSSTFAVLALDVADFYTIRDRYGHSLADDLLVGLADRLLDSARPIDAVGRIPDAEFVVVLPELAQVSDAWAVAWRLEAGLTAPLELCRDLELQIATRWGVTLADSRFDGPHDLLGAAVLESKTF